MTTPTELSEGETASLTPEAPPALPAFNPARLEAELLRDRVLRLALGLLVGVAVSAVLVWLPGAYGIDPGLSLMLAALLVLGVWVSRAVTNAKAAGAARGLLAAAELSPPNAEVRLQPWLDRRALVDWVRLMLYQAWATLRHRQGRHAEAAAICASVLRRPLGPGEGARPQLLLLLAESSLEANDPWGAYFALTQLHGTPVTLNQLLQRVGLQVRYEVTLGNDHAALAHWPRKAELAELMPGPLCGVTHAMLGLAAYRTEQHDAAAWLTHRAELLCEPAQLKQLREQHLAVPAVDVSA
ncbi:MAG: hypothetical protein AAF328_11020 [Planctomycetota bacterium]